MGKGLTARTDPRTARMAEARGGKQRGPYCVRATRQWAWSASTPPAANTSIGFAAGALHYGLAGGVWCEDGLYQLTYGKRASLRLPPLMYPTKRSRVLHAEGVWLQFLREGGRVTR